MNGRVLSINIRAYLWRISDLRAMPMQASGTDR